MLSKTNPFLPRLILPRFVAAHFVRTLINYRGASGSSSQVVHPLVVVVSGSTPHEARRVKVSTVTWARGQRWTNIYFLMKVGFRVMFACGGV